MTNYKRIINEFETDIAIGQNPYLEAEIRDTLQRIEDGTYEYVGEIKLKVKPSYWEINDGW